MAAPRPGGFAIRRHGPRIPTGFGVVRVHDSFTVEAQTQIVVLEGPVLVEHYVASADRTSMVGNIYLAKVRNVLPGMEASFLDFGAAKNGVLYASDVSYDRKKHRNGPPRIEESLAEGDEALVQVVKDPMGAKGARLTGTPSLPGRYLVLVPDSDSHGISRRLPEEERTRLRKIIDDVKPDGFGVIVRTAALHASAEEIAADISRLVKTWEEITQKAADGGAPSVVYSEPDLLIRVIREHFTADFRRMLIEDKGPTRTWCPTCGPPHPTSCPRSSCMRTRWRCSSAITSTISCARPSSGGCTCPRVATW
jgi:ribonuclease E